MKPYISEWPVQQFYDGKVKDAKTFNDKEGESLKPLSLHGHQAAYCWLQIVGTERKDDNGSTYNQAEAEAVVSLLQQLSESGDPSWNSSEKIRVITFYQAQVNYIRLLLRKYNVQDVTVSTVDSSQGCEADIVILSFVRGTSGHVGFLKDDRRLNVALTRAKSQLICIGNLDAIVGLDAKGGNLVVKEMATDAMKRDSVKVFEADSLPHPRFEEIVPPSMAPSKRTSEGNGDGCYET